MIRKQFLFFIFLLCVVGLNAQVRFTTSAPEAVVEGEQFGGVKFQYGYW